MRNGIRSISYPKKGRIMKAAILEHYDKAGTDLIVRETPLPHVGANDVLVHVSCAGVNPLDNMIIRKEVKLIVDYSMPLVMGNEFVGVIEQLGESVQGFSEGDRVYARMPLDNIGAFAEYVRLHTDAIAKVPDYLSDEEAACVPLTSLTALQAYELMGVKPGGKLFISGGTGSVGAMAIPIAKDMGLYVATSGNGNSAERMSELGVDEFIDYKKQDFANVVHDVDYVLDTLGDKVLPKEFQILKQGGTLVSLRGMPNGAFAKRMGMGWVKRLLFSIAGRKYDKMAARRRQTYQFMFVHADGRGLARISRIFEEKHVQPSVDGVFSLDEVNAALQKVKAGGSKGKTILRIT